MKSDRFDFHMGEDFGSAIRLFLGSARQSVKVFVLRGFLETHILVLRSRQRQDSHQNGQNSGFAVEMTLGGTSGRILAEDLLPVPPSLETRTKRGFPHFHSDHGGGLLIATSPNPNKIGGAYRFLRRTVITLLPATLRL